MRARDDVPLAELAKLFDRYMSESDRFARAVFAGQTQMGRSLVHEEALPEGDHTEILDWERASRIVASASAVGVSLCPCRHEASHLGRACDRPMEICLSFNYAAETLAHMGTARLVSTDEGLRLLARAKDAGLAQTGDNVQRKVAYICNCCGCCCGMMAAIRTFDIRNAIVTSNWLMAVDADACRGCGKCVKACPVNAIALKGEEAKLAVRDETLCLGCGVCYSACKFGAISMKPRERRVHTPETIFDRTVAMAIERGKLADLLFDDPERLSHRALGRLLRVIEKTPPWKAAMAIRPLRSVFLSALVRGAKRQAGELAEALV
jgi:ferredoxin